MNDKSADEPFKVAVPDFEKLATNMGRLVEQAGRATAASLRSIEEGKAQGGLSDEVSDAVKTLGAVAERWLSDPQKALEAQTRLTSGLLDLWAHTLKRFQGEAVDPIVAGDPRDSRFRDAEWRDNPLFDFIRQAYLMTSDWAEKLVDEAGDVDEHTRHKAQFYVRQLSSALSPSNFLATNPELLRETLKQSGDNLVRGLKMFAEDVEAGGGELKIRQSDNTKFEVGVNLATTPGKVVFRNELIELIQYAPATQTVFRRPLLIVPPWINKFYILDLNPKKSFIRWCVEQGLTVFCIFAALDAIGAATGEESVTAIGYCVGGTLLSATLGYMAATGDRRIDSATLFTTQVDFQNAGDLKVFVDETQIEAIEEQMKPRGYLEGRRMANAFNMLRPNDLIWSYVVNNYLKGQAPFAFDLLYWNADSTRMPAANHSFYLRNCYLENKLSRGEMVLAGKTLDLKKVTIPIYNLATREDHIAPAKSVFVGSKAFGGEVRYVLAGSGHIAGVVNPPAKGKYQYWVGGPVKGELEEWIAKASEHPGSWWPDWIAWIAAQAPDKVKARKPGGGKLKALCDAPGTYVKIRA